MRSFEELTFMAEIRVVKREMREKYSAIRNEMDKAKRDEFDKKIFDRLTASITYRHSNEILLYASMGSEIDTWAIFDAAIKAGKKVAYPLCFEDNTMKYYYVSSRDDLEEGAFGILEPKKGLEEYVPSSLSICVVPAIVFDKEGYRIGYGKGFYDRFLSSFPGVKVGLVYSNMIIPRVPRGRFDKHVDILISERGVSAVNASR